MIKKIKAKVRALILRIKKALHYCPQCTSYATEDGQWNRGWNNQCEQAYSDSGMYCTNCGHIDWEQSLEKHKESLPAWCTPNPNRN